MKVSIGNRLFYDYISIHFIHSFLCLQFLVLASRLILYVLFGKDLREDSLADA